MGNPNQTVYNRIKLFRIAANLSREKLAQRAEVNFQTIGYLERQEYNPSLTLALKLAQIFDVSVEDLFSLEPFDSILPTKLN
ncbi:MAG: helix-turn-helix transcriptional regulator [Patescibacteria group bacterium]